MSYNSVSEPRFKVVVSIPKGAIMSKEQQKQVKAQQCFNSKRCDYELLIVCKKGTDLTMFQFQKVRL